MKRFLTIIALTTSLVTVLAALALAAGPAIVGDDFQSGGYNGAKNSGDGSWLGPWIEVGESNGPSAGNVQVGTQSGCSGSCLVVTGALFFDTAGAVRTAEVLGAHTVTTGYRLSVRGIAAASVRVQVNVDGAGWTTVATRSLSGTYSETLGTSNGTVGIRFVVDGLSIGGSVGIDDVALTFTPVPVTTTTTTTASTTTTTTAATTTTLPTITIPPLLTTTTTTITLPGDTTTTTRATATTTTVPGTTTTTTVRSDQTGEDGGAVPPHGWRFRPDSTSFRCDHHPR